MLDEKVKTEPTFNVYGPYEVPTIKDTGGFSFKAFKEILVEKDGWSDEAGCYVICRSTPRALLPLYVGRSTTNLLQRIAGHKKRIDEILARSENKAKLKIFLLHYEKKNGRLNESAIDLLETELIKMAGEKGIALDNIQKITRRKIKIAGVVGSAPGRRKSASVEFRKAFRIEG